MARPQTMPLPDGTYAVVFTSAAGVGHPSAAHTCPIGSLDPNDPRLCARCARFVKCKLAATRRAH